MKTSNRAKPSTFNLPTWREVLRRFSFSRRRRIERASVEARLDRGLHPKPRLSDGLRSNPARRQALALERIEPSVLMSADLSYMAAANGDTFHLIATGAKSFELDSASAGNVGTATLTDGTLNVEINSALGFSNANTLHINLDTFNQLDASFINSQGGLNIVFNEGKSIAAGVASNPDHLSVDGSSATLGSAMHPFDLTIQSNSDIASSAKANITGGFSLLSQQSASDSEPNGLFAIGNTGVTLTGANYTVSGAFNL